MVLKKKIGVVGVPQDLGASRRGVDMGPSAIRIAGLHTTLTRLGYEIQDFGNLHCHDIEEHALTKPTNPQLRFLDEIVDMSSHIKETLTEILEQQCFPLILGGDHSINIGTMSGLKKLHAGKTGILWVDAHGDFNTEQTTVSGNIHGMPFAVATNRGNPQLTSLGPSPTVLEENAVHIGGRDIDVDEAQLMKDSLVSVFTMRKIDELGMAAVAKKAIEISTKGVEYLHVSFDIDSLDPSEAPGTGTRVPGGLTYREAHLIMEMVHDCGKLSSLEVVEVNPALDIRNKTANLAVGLIASALGKTII